MTIDVQGVVGVILTASGGAFVREVLIGIAKLRHGIAGGEHRRQGDVVAQRDRAVATTSELELERDAAVRRADLWERYSSDLREFCLAHGTPLNSLPARPPTTGVTP